MNDRIKKVKQYLLDLDTTAEAKRYTLNFCKKMDYIQSIMSQAINETHEHFDFGYGNYNAKICIVANTISEFNEIKQRLQKVLEKFGSNFWNVYVTYVYKTKNEYRRSINLLMNEINAISPNIVYIFGRNEKVANSLKDEFIKYNVGSSIQFYFIDIDKFLNPSDDDRKRFWNMFKYLINYKEVIEE